MINCHAEVRRFDAIEQDLIELGRAHGHKGSGFHLRTRKYCDPCLILQRSFRSSQQSVRDDWSSAGRPKVAASRSAARD